MNLALAGLPAFEPVVEMLQQLARLDLSLAHQAVVAALAVLAQTEADFAVEVPDDLAFERV